MAISIHMKGFLLAVGTSALSLGSAFAVGTGLRTREAHVSHQQPDLEHWGEGRKPSSPELVARGRQQFLKTCAHCHAADARGDEGPDLHGLQVSDRYIARTILRGIPGEMPSFAKKLDPTAVTALIAYLRTLHEDDEPVAVGESGADSSADPDHFTSKKEVR